MSKKIMQLKRMLGRLMCAPLVGKILALVYRNNIPNRGCLIDTSSPLIMPSVKASLWWGLYEGAEVRFVQQYLRTDLNVIELGGSAGVVTAHIARKISLDRSIFSIEMAASLIEEIHKNVNINAPGAKLIVIQVAIDYGEGESVEYVAGLRNTDSRIEKNSAIKGIQVPTVTLSRLLEQNSVGEYSLVADIEGAEIGILMNEKQALLHCQQMIIELHNIMQNEQLYTVDQMRNCIQREHGFSLVASKGNVYVFER